MRQTTFSRSTDYQVTAGNSVVGTYPNQEDAQSVAGSVPHDEGGVDTVHGPWQSSGGHATDGFAPVPNRAFGRPSLSNPYEGNT